ncbi:MAG: hypothetical protein AAF734_09870, partial [Bacteroidota bacterium]
RTSCYSLGYIGAILCQKCFKEYEQDYLREKTVEKSHFIGAVSALIFSLPAVLVWVILEVYLGRIAIIIAPIILLLNRRGYDYVKGKTDHYKKYVIIGTGTFCIVLASIAVQTVCMLQEELSPTEALQRLITTPQILRAALANVLFGYFITVVYGIALLRLLLREEREVKLAEKVK